PQELPACGVSRPFWCIPSSTVPAICAVGRKCLPVDMQPGLASCVPPVMLSHVSLGTNDAARAAAFYDPVLAVLGIAKGKRRGGSVDYSAAMIGFSLEQPVDGK